jgi:hypothetical protein
MGVSKPIGGFYERLEQDWDWSLIIGVGWRLFTNDR